MVSAEAPAITDEAADRPLALLFIYSWDMARALFALIGALVSFGGAVELNGHEVAVPGYAQAIAALSDVSFAASLIIVAVVLARRQLWVRQAQTISLGLAIALIVASVAAQRVTDPGALIGNGVFILIDVVALWSMASTKVRDWYVEPGRMPAYITWALVFWAAINATLVLYEAVGAPH